MTNTRWTRAKLVRQYQFHSENTLRLRAYRHICRLQRRQLYKAGNLAAEGTQVATAKEQQPERKHTEQLISADTGCLPQDRPPAALPALPAHLTRKSVQHARHRQPQPAKARHQHLQAQKR